MGRFICPDPIGLSGGVNLSSYAPNPVFWADPAGLESDPVPAVDKGFADWFNNMTPDEFDKVWKEQRSTIENRLRHPGGTHEWLPVSRADVFKRWGISAEQIWEWRTSTKTTGGINPDWQHGKKGSPTAHNEIFNIIKNSLNFEEFRRQLNNWANFRLVNGVMDLPAGLRKQC